MVQPIDGNSVLIIFLAALIALILSPCALILLGALARAAAGLRDGGSNCTPGRLLEDDGVPVSNVPEWYNGRYYPPVTVAEGGRPPVIIRVGGVWHAYPPSDTVTPASDFEPSTARAGGESAYNFGGGYDD